MPARPHAFDGELDPSFGSGGKIQVSFATPVGVGLLGSTTATDVAVQADGKILVAGYADYLVDTSTHCYAWVEGRFNADGSLDTSFGGSGTGFTGHYSGGHVENQALGIQVRPNGKIVVGGTIADGPASAQRDTHECPPQKAPNKGQCHETSHPVFRPRHNPRKIS
ncbi:MAG: hypothetical protein ABIQ70_13560 [Dokdonella sp.]